MFRVFTALVLLAATASATGARRLGPAVRRPEMTDVWFDADAPRVATSLGDRWSEKHRRAQVHPRFPLLTVPSYALQALGLTRARAVSVLVGAAAFSWPVAAALFTGLGLASAACVFWLAVPESFAFGSATVMCGLMPAALAGRLPVRERWTTVASAFSLSVTTPNWTAGLLAAAASHPWWRSPGER